MGQEFENLAVRLCEIYARSPHLVLQLPEFFFQRWRDEHKHGWVHTAERTLLGSPQLSFRDALLLFVRERVPEYFDASIMAHRNLEISREVVRLMRVSLGVDTWPATLLDSVSLRGFLGGRGEEWPNPGPARRRGRRAEAGPPLFHAPERGGDGPRGAGTTQGPRTDARRSPDPARAHL